MADEENNKALVKRSEGGLTTSGRKTTGIMTRMTGDWLAAAKSSGAIAKDERFRIGDYEFRKPDYEQILRWAYDLSLTPEEIIEQLSGQSYRNDVMGVEFEFSATDGSIRSLILNFEALPLNSFDWVPSLKIERLAITNWKLGVPHQLTAPLPQLDALFCDACGITEIDLGGSPKLSVISVHNNRLSKLDLSRTNGLRHLWCTSNQIAELDLSNVPELTELWCHGNQLTELDLSNVPELTKLYCSMNQITELDVADVPGLKSLLCRSNPIRSLNLKRQKLLVTFDCDDTVKVRGNPRFNQH